MSFIIAMQSLTPEEAEQIWITTQDPDRKEAMQGYENKEVYHDLSERDFEEMKENPELYNHNLKQ